MTSILIFVLSICASFIQRTIGFGFGIFIMTMLPFLMPSYGEATALSGLLALTTSMVTAFRMRRYVSWKRLMPILFSFALISAFAISVLKRSDEHVLRYVLGAVLILSSIYFAFFSSRLKFPSTFSAQIGAGALSGIMGGFFGMQGPPAVLYFIASEPDKDHYIAMTQWYFFLGNLLMTFVRAGNGFVTQSVGTGYLYGLGGVVVGTLSGAYVFRKMTGSILRYLVYAYIGISGIIVLLTA
ncbi:MAG: sulfite exporter TauE/SafE family protein [Clostridium sp.]|nr:sulfite exporter TauE/SafE family protein [Bacteroides sp.]MCM1198902.1 sulfite exporter TauE/SafE family protein [Clostridium sp.]